MYKCILFIIVIFNLLCMCKTWEEHITYYYGDLIEFNVNINERHKIKTLSYNDVLLYYLIILIWMEIIFWTIERCIYINIGLNQI